jgi:hypothetical protein
VQPFARRTTCQTTKSSRCVGNGGTPLFRIRRLSSYWMALTRVRAIRGRWRRRFMARAAG